MAKLEIVTANGNHEELAISDVLILRKEIDEEIITRSSEVVAGIASAYSNIAQGYFSLLPWIARAHAEKTHENYSGIKSTNMLVQAIIGCAKSSASELVKVATTFYTSSGELIDGWQPFSYSELIAIANVDAERREEARKRVLELEDRSRKSVKALIKKMNESSDDNASNGSSDQGQEQKTDPDSTSNGQSNDNVSHETSDSSSTGSTTEPDGESNNSSDDSFTAVDPIKGYEMMMRAYAKTIEDLGDVIKTMKKSDKSYAATFTVYNTAKQMFYAAADELRNNAIETPAGDFS